MRFPNIPGWVVPLPAALIAALYCGFIKESTGAADAVVNEARVQKTAVAQKAVVNQEPLEEIVLEDTSAAKIRVRKYEVESFAGFEHVDEYDYLVLTTTEFWNNVFEDLFEKNGWAGYEMLDPNLVKSIIIQESGTKGSKAFRHDPMQIANEGDFGLRVLQEGLEGVLRFLDRGGLGRFKPFKETPLKKRKLDYGVLDDNERITAEASIDGGILLLWMKKCVLDSGVVEEGKFGEYVVRKGDSLFKIAKEQGTTVSTLRKYNPAVSNTDFLREGMRLWVKPARNEFYVRGTLPWREAVKAYNGSANSEKYAGEVFGRLGISLGIDVPDLFVPVKVLVNGKVTTTFVPQFKGLPASNCSGYVRRAAAHMFGLEYEAADAWDRRLRDRIVVEDNGNVLNLDELENKGDLRSGMVVGMRNPRSGYNGRKDSRGEPVKYTHVALYIGTGVNGQPLLAHQLGSKQEVVSAGDLIAKGLEAMEILSAR